MYSFYGGRPGNSFIIVKNFISVEDMVNNFKNGPNYPDVHYDEYVLINTRNKLNEENGRIYRRGYNYQDDMGGAEYIGTIVGPQGNAPHLHLTTPNMVDNIHWQSEAESSTIISSESYSDDEQWANLPKPQFIPGMQRISNNNSDEEVLIQYNDEIIWKTCSIRTENNDITHAYIGLTIPYPVFEFSTKTISEYENANIERLKTEDNLDHPFFYNQQISIPKGIHGDSIVGVYITNYATEESKNIINLPEAYKSNTTKPFFMCEVENYDNGKEDSIIYNQSELKEAEKIGKVQKKYYYIGEYKVVKDITLNQNGTLTKKYNDNTEDELGTLKWIDNISLSDNGKLEITYNNNTTDELGPLKWIDNISLSNDGELEITYNNSGFENYTTTLEWIKDITLDQNGTLTKKYTGNKPDIVESLQWIDNLELSEDGKLKAHFNTGVSSSDILNTLKWINNISLSDDGELKITYNTKNSQNNQNQSASFTLKWIDDIQFNENNNGKLKIVYNTKNSQNNQNQYVEFDNAISQITDMKILKAEDIPETPAENDPTSTDIGKLAYQINNDTKYHPVGEPINYVEKMALDDANRILVKYSDPQKQGSIQYDRENGWSAIGNLTTNFQLGIGDNNPFYNASWTGIGEVVEFEEDSQNIGATLNFCINPSYYLSQYLQTQINSITISMQPITINAIDNNQIRKLSNLKIQRFFDQTNNVYSDYAQYIENDEKQSSSINMDNLITMNVTPLGMNFKLFLNKNNFQTLNYSFDNNNNGEYDFYPRIKGNTNTIQYFCNISITNLDINFKLDQFPDNGERKLFGQYYQYDWDSRDGWNAAMTQELFDKPFIGGDENKHYLKYKNNVKIINEDQNNSVKALAQRIAYFNSYPFNYGVATYDENGVRTQQAQAIRVSRVWHGEGTKEENNTRVYGLTDPECYFVDIVRPPELQKTGVHIISIQILWFEASLPILVYAKDPGNSVYRERLTEVANKIETSIMANNHIALTTDSDFNTLYQEIEDLETIKAPYVNSNGVTQFKEVNARKTLECIKAGKNQYFRIIIKNPQGTNRTTPKNLHIALRFLYTIQND